MVTTHMVLNLVMMKDIFNNTMKQTKIPIYRKECGNDERNRMNMKDDIFYIADSTDAEFKWCESKIHTMVDVEGVKTPISLSRNLTKQFESNYPILRNTIFFKQDNYYFEFKKAFILGGSYFIEEVNENAYNIYTIPKGYCRDEGEPFIVESTDNLRTALEYIRKMYI